MCKNVCFNDVKEGVHTKVPIQNTSVTMSLKQLLKFTAPGNHRHALKHLCSWLSSSRKTFGYATSAQCPFEYTHAITRGIPKSFAEHSLKMDPSQQIVLSRATEQLRKYVDILKECGLEVITIPADEQYPDCVFVEDTALVIGQKACLTRPGHETRRGEVLAVKDALQNFGIETQELDDPSAILDGGDIIFTGQEILVGESLRSNKAGAESLQRAFPEFPVTQVPIRGTLHLKSVATLAQDGVLLVSGSKAGQEVLKALQAKMHGKYRFIQVTKDESANVVLCNGRAIIKSEKDIGPADFKILTSGLTVPTIEAEFDEFYKADGCLTCCSILLQSP